MGMNINQKGARRHPKRRTGTITLEEAKKKFNEYYNKRGKSPIGIKRAKMFDMMYQKKDKFTLEPNKPGSERYLLDEGPRTFDMKGVDWFPEGVKVTVPESNIDIISKGSSVWRNIDEK